MMADVEIKYKGVTRATMTASGAKTVKTGGKWVEGDIVVVYNKPSGPQPSGTKQINITENGTTTEDVAAYANAEITVNVPTSGIAAGYEITANPASGEPDVCHIKGVEALMSAVSGTYNLNRVLTLIIESPCKTIEQNTLRSVTATRIELPNTITSIHAQAFRGASHLTTPIFEEGFTASCSFYESASITRDAILGLIAAYADNSGATLTLHATPFALLTSDDLAAATAKGLTIASA